jgi:hypothetical protein
VVVPSIVVIVAEALAGGVTVAGLTEQLGGSVIDWIVDVTWQPRLTLPLKPLSVPTVTFEDDVPPGATASGDSVSACSVKVWAAASDGKIRNAANRHKTAVSARPDHAELNGLDSNGLDFNDWDFNESAFNDSDFNVSDFDASVLNASDCDDSDFNMSRSKFKYFDSQDNPKAARPPDDARISVPFYRRHFPRNHATQIHRSVPTESSILSLHRRPSSPPAHKEQRPPKEREAALWVGRDEWIEQHFCRPY